MRGQAQFLVKMRTRIGRQRLPPFQGALEGFTLRAIRRFRDVIEGGLVRRHHAGAGTTFNGHVADRHAACHVQSADCITSIFNHMPGAARRADLADDGQHNILAGTAKGQIAIHGDAHVLGRLLQQRLRRQHMFHFGRTNAESECPHGAMGRGMAIAAHNRHARQRTAKLRPDHMHNALTVIEQRDVRHAEFNDVLFQGINLQAAFGVHNAGATAVIGRDIMVHHGERRIRAAHLAPRGAQAIKSLRRGHFMGQMKVNIKQRRSIREGFHHMGIPNLVEQRARLLR